MVDGIPVLFDDSTIGTALDRIDDYSALMGIDESVIRQTGTEWKTIIGGLGYTPEHALEIGAGTGALTLGLLEAGTLRSLTSTDVSLKFLRSLAPQVARHSTPVSLIACDANEPHFRSEAFDLVVGRSVLHHLLDYEQTLALCRSVLKPGAAAVFYEPVLEGKTITTLLMALMLRGDEMTNGGQFSEEDRQRIQRQIRKQMRSVLLPQDRESLSKLEDKYIFDIEKMKRVGLDVGFTDVAFVNDGRGLSYLAYVSHACRVAGVAPEKIRAFKWIEEVFAETYGRIYPERLVSPTGYFVFHR
jgi:ubiquinone/menaquinone biosynthesis C-methylase UbiE